MIHPILHNTLFKTSKKEVIENYKISKEEVSKWYKLNFLSFDFDTLDEFEDPQFLELIFINTLISSCKNETVFNYLLSKLQKPYSYKYHEIYFDVFADEWKKLPVEKEISDYSFEEIVDELLDNCKEEEDKIEVISDYISELSSRLIE